MTRYPFASWRLLITPPVDGATNMAIDEAILYALADGVGRPTLRFYQWDPPCLSLGYNQPCAEVDELACSHLGYTWVRRPTGGRAILHTDELTYSLVVPGTETRVAGGVVESYRQLSLGLLAGLRSLGADVFQPQTEKVINPDHGPACFDTPSNYEITVSGKKLIGSAQVRRRGVVLQHGTLPLTGDLNRIFGCIRVANSVPVATAGSSGMDRPGGDLVQSAPSLADRACTLEYALGRVASFDEVAGVLSQGFATALNLRLEPGELTDYERSTSERLRREQYANDTWNRRV